MHLLSNDLIHQLLHISRGYIGRDVHYDMIDNAEKERQLWSEDGGIARGCAILKQDHCRTCQPYLSYNADPRHKIVEHGNILRR